MSSDSTPHRATISSTSWDALTLYSAANCWARQKFEWHVATNCDLPPLDRSSW